MRGQRKIINAIEHYLFPISCALCGLPLLRGETDGLCSSCAADIEIEPEPRCRYCGRPLIVESEICLECRANSVPVYDRMKAVFRYGAAGKRLLAAYKFGEHRALVRYFSGIMLSSLKPPFYFPDEQVPIIPVPPRPGKLRQKGWDQVDLLATYLEHAGLPLMRCLRRLESNSQKALNRIDRRINLKGKIICIEKPPQKVLLLDDVVTTGATINACAESLKNAGAKIVIAMTLFYD